jgi:leucyl-tRNA synthetase
MTGRYAHHEFEEKWGKVWEETGAFRWRNDPSKPKRYVLEMFPYASGRMHIGHARNYTMGDILARMARARGDDVLYPMGWDAFGLPAENAAILSGIHPAIFTRNAIESMKAAMRRLGLSYDWTREVNTSSPEYIRAQQTLFLLLFERGLVYRDTSFVNWCERCQTVLANEQAATGRCWRCDTPVVKRRVPQWFVNIRSYADELLDNLDQLAGWPESVKNIQRAWIGRSEGTEILFDVDGLSEPLRVFTTRPDTLFGCTFVVVAPEHPLLDRLALAPDRHAEVFAFRERVLLQTSEERAQHANEKVGVATGVFALNPINGERVPIWTANYVLMDYGTGAIMAVPAHDQRDFDFARRHNIPVRTVIVPAKEGQQDSSPKEPAAYENEGILVASGDFTGMSSQDARRAITETLGARGVGRATRQYRLQNWSVSRQRYWGDPIPIVHCERDGAVPVPETELPLLLPEQIDFAGLGNPLARSVEYINTTCPRCGGPAERDPDTMDTFVDSAWYYLRYPDPHGERPFDGHVVNRMLPVDTYIGGVEHATLHLMYARFFVKALRDLGLLAFDEPFARLYNHGMVNDAEGRRQSKSRGNIVEPLEVIDRYGADALRVYLMFITAYNMQIDWDDTGPKDAQAYLNRVWRLAERLRPGLAAHRDVLPDTAICIAGPEQELRKVVHETIKKVTGDVETLQFNTALAALMTLTNVLYAYPPDAHQQPAAAAYRTLVRLLGIFAPFVCEELWSAVGGEGLLVQQPWPVHDEQALLGATKEIAVQVNGKFVTSVQVAQRADEDAILQAALGEMRVAHRVDGKSVRKVIHVPNRLVNIIAS